MLLQIFLPVQKTASPRCGFLPLPPPAPPTQLPPPPSSRSAPLPPTSPTLACPTHPPLPFFARQAAADGIKYHRQTTPCNYPWREVIDWWKRWPRSDTLCVASRGRGGVSRSGMEHHGVAPSGNEPHACQEAKVLLFGHDCLRPPPSGCSGR